jgi:hypothetical protein
LLIFVVVAVAHSLSPAVQIGDSRLSVPVADAVIRHGSFDLRGNKVVAHLTNRYDLVTRDERLLPFYPWPPMLLALPGVAIFTLAGRDPAELHPSDPNQTWMIEIPTASVLVALTALVLAVIAMETMTGDLLRRRRFAVAVALLYAFSTGAWSTGSRALWQHTPSMLLLTAVVLFAIRIRRHWTNAVFFGASLALAFAVRPTNAVAVATMLVWLVVTNRQALVRALGGAAAVAMGFVAISFASYGSVLPPYYAATRLGGKRVLGFGETLAMNLVSPSRGLLIYDPVVLLAVAGVVILYRRHKLSGLSVAIVTVVVGQGFVIARYGSTEG